jgi:hypothetical protein
MKIGILVIIEKNYLGALTLIPAAPAHGVNGATFRLSVLEAFIPQGIIRWRWSSSSGVQNSIDDTRDYLQQVQL